MVAKRNAPWLLLPRVLVMLALAPACGNSGGIRVVGDGGSRGDGPPGSQDLLAGPGDMAGLPPDQATPVDFTIPPDFTVIPDLSVACLAGRYNGPAKANATVGGLPLMLTGTVDLTLGAPQNGVLHITSGRLMGMTAQGNGTATAMITGDLDCSQRRLVNGMIVNGTAVYMGFPVPFTGTINGDYDIGTHAFVNGTLSTMGVMGMGTWSATWLGP